MLISKNSPDTLHFRVPFQTGDVWRVVTDQDIGLWMQPDRDAGEVTTSVALGGWTRFVNTVIYFCVIRVYTKNETWKEEYSHKEFQDLVYNLRVITDSGKTGMITISGPGKNWHLISRQGI